MFRSCAANTFAHAQNTHTHNTRRRSDVNQCAGIPEISFYATHERNAVQAYIAAPVLVAEYYRKRREMSGRKGKKCEAERTYIDSRGILCSSLNMHRFSLFVD